MKNEYSNNELNQFDILTDELIIWMFHKPNDRHPIIQTIKKAFDIGKSSQKTEGEKK